MSTTPKTAHQKDVLNCHLEFLRRTTPGLAVFTVQDIKIGSRISNLHITLSQGEDVNHLQDEALGYFTMSNFAKEEGQSLETGWQLLPRPLPIDLKQCEEIGQDDNWHWMSKLAFPEFRKATQHIKMHLMKPDRIPNHHQAGKVDQWVRLCPQEQPGKWTNDSLGFAVDMFPQVVEVILDGGMTHLQRGLHGEKTGQQPIARGWYPTLSLNLDVKKGLPDQGVEWLFVRMQAKRIRNGRMDLDIYVLDEAGDLVASSTHQSLVVGVDRNTAKRTKKSRENKI